MRTLHPDTRSNYNAYKIFRPVFIKAHPYCEMSLGCCHPSSEIHHMMGHGYRGKLLCYEPWCKASCIKCHRWVEDHKIEARKLGLILYK